MFLSLSHVGSCAMWCLWSGVVLDCFVCLFDSLHHINNLSVIKGRVFLGGTSTKLGLMYLLKDTTQ